jgi:hypothetical protein
MRLRVALKFRYVLLLFFSASFLSSSHPLYAYPDLDDIFAHETH